MSKMSKQKLFRKKLKRNGRLKEGNLYHKEERLGACYREWKRELCMGAAL